MGRKQTISDDKLLAVARIAFVELGPSVSTREIARRAQVSEGVLFQRFGTKANLFFAAMVPPVLDLGSAPETKVSSAEARQRLERLVFRLVDYFRETAPVLGTLLLHPDFNFEDFARRHPDSSLVSLRRDLTQRLHEEQRLGHIGQAEAGSMALLLISLGHTVAVFEQLGAHDARIPDSIIQAAFKSLWEGFAPD